MICFAILAHDNEDVLQDQIVNLRKYNPGDKIVVYNGGPNREFARTVDVDVCPHSRPLKKGRLGRFLYDIMTWLEDIDLQYDYLVNVDSDVMFVRAGFGVFLQQTLQGYDCMGINMEILHSKQDAPHWYPGQTMWAEWSEWKPFFGLDFFAGCLNCMQVYRREIARKMTHGLDREYLERLLTSTRVFALEEILHPTLAIRAGARHRPYPQEVAKFVRIGEDYTPEEVSASLRDPQAFFIHPVERVLLNPTRSLIGEMSLCGPDIPSSLTIIWACCQGGVETAAANRLRQLNEFGAKAHVYFYHKCTGVEICKGIPHHFGRTTDSLIQCIQSHSFNYVTFVNTLHNLEDVVHSGYKGICLFEFHGFAQPIMEELNRINRGEDHGHIKGVVVPGSHVASIATSALWRRPDIDIYVAQNTVDTGLFRKLPISNSTIGSLGAPEKWGQTPLIGWVGRVERAKNWSMLLRIFVKLRRQHPNIKLLMAADTAQSGELHKFFRKVRKYKAVHDVVLLPNIPHTLMPLYYSMIGQSGGVLLSTSLSEGYPYHLLEAQACECPVVCANGGGAVEAVAHGATGLIHIYDVQDATVLATRFMTQPELRDRMTREAREKICAVNALDANVSRYAAWLRQLQDKAGRCDRRGD